MFITDENNELLVLVKRQADWKDGLDFLTGNDQFLQVGTWNYDAGKQLDRHYHNNVERVSTLTQECVAVFSGAMEVTVYDKQRNHLTEFTLSTGDFAVFLGGGHEYRILENGTRILESKNGPFLGVDADKTRF